jgi:hypothetical protein
MTNAGVLRQQRFVVSHAANLVCRRFHVPVRDQDDLCIALCLDVVQPLALLVHEIGRDFHRQLRDDFDRTVFARFLADETQQCEREGIDAADRPHAVATRAGDAGGFADRRSQALT